MKGRFRGKLDRRSTRPAPIVGVREALLVHKSSGLERRARNRFPTLHCNVDIERGARLFLAKLHGNPANDGIVRSARGQGRGQRNEIIFLAGHTPSSELKEQLVQSEAGFECTGHPCSIAGFTIAKKSAAAKVAPAGDSGRVTFVDTTAQRAELAYARGDNQTARQLYEELQKSAEKGIEPEVPELVVQRLHALSLDRFAFALGLGSLGIIFTSLVFALALA